MIHQTEYIAPLIRDATELWRDNLIYWDGRGYRWTRSPGGRDRLPANAVPGRIATPYNQWLKGIGPQDLHELGKKIESEAAA